LEKSALRVIGHPSADAPEFYAENNKNCWMAKRAFSSEQLKRILVKNSF
jgi:hypothetical protein